MPDKDKLFLVFYVDVTDIEKCDVHVFLTDFSEYFKSYLDDSIVPFFIPISNEGSTRIECINPKLITEEEYQKIEKIISNFEEKTKEYYEKF